MENYLEKWNPLEIISMNAEENYRQLAINSTKQQIRNILKSYVGYYDPFVNCYRMQWMLQIEWRIL